MQLIQKIEHEQLKERAPFHIGDSVKVHLRVREGDKERIQIFNGVVIARKGRGLNEQFTVRRLSRGDSVERILPLHSPAIEKIEVDREAKVRRSKLYYLRKRNNLNLKPRKTTSAKNAASSKKSKASPKKAALEKSATE